MINYKQSIIQFIWLNRSGSSQFETKPTLEELLSYDRKTLDGMASSLEGNYRKPNEWESTHFEWLTSLDKHELIYINHLVANHLNVHALSALINNAPIKSYFPNSRLHYSDIDHLTLKRLDTKKNMIERITCNVINNFSGRHEAVIDSLSTIKKKFLESTKTKNDLLIFYKKAKQSIKESTYSDEFTDWFIRYTYERTKSEHSYKLDKIHESADTHFTDAFLAEVYLFGINNLKDAKILSTKTKSAWSQKKHRDSLNGRKSRSYSLTEKAIEQLESISQTQRRRKNEILEILIEDAWLEMSGQKKPARR